MPMVPFARPDITEREIAAVTEVLRSGWLTSGPTTRRFERAFAAAVGARHAVALNSGTAALHLALEAAGIGRGDEVIVPSMTFAATAEVVVHTGATPVFVDVDSSDHNISVDAVERATSPRTRAIIPVDFGGQPPDLQRLLEWARSHDLVVIEDAAHGFPARYRGTAIGNIADITCFSFYATKTITCGEGGMVTTNREEWGSRIRLLSLHGIAHGGHGCAADDTRPWNYDIVDLGWKYNLADPAAAMGLIQLQRSSDMWARRRDVARRYLESFADFAALEPLVVRVESEPSWHLFVVKLVPDVLSIDRDRFILELRVRGIETSVHFIPLHLHSYYRTAFGHSAQDFPAALDAYNRSLSLPIYSAMNEEEVECVVRAVSDVCREFRL